MTVPSMIRVCGRLALALFVASAAGCASTPEPEPEAPAPPAAPAPSVDPVTRVGAVDELPEPGVERRNPADRAGLDVTHYDLSVDLRQLADTMVEAVARLDVRPAPGSIHIDLDFVGLEVDSARLDGVLVPFAQGPDILRIDPGTALEEAVTVEVFYGGRPRDGLFIGPDPAGDLTAFADNWPNRARWWFPSNDHPADKATAAFSVRVPPGYSVIANGRLVDVEGDTWRWRTDVELPAYTLVIGVARFERATIGDGACGAAPTAAKGDCAEVSVWALSGSGAYGEQRFSRGADMLDFYSDLFGPYPYEKLAHVQSSTRFGGMENSSAIFYAMGGWAEERMGEGVIAHETVHQWFGDGVTPAKWSHLWVSEGFATYFAAVYLEDRDGGDALRQAMDRGRRAVVGSDASNRPVVDERPDLFGLLNTNSYPKGAWILHMLRTLIGDEAFFGAVRAYYAAHENGVADTDDVRRAMEEASDRDLTWFFEQWAYSPGFPKLAVTTEADGDELAITVDQVQAQEWPTFRGSWLDIDVTWESGEVERVGLWLTSRSNELRVPSKGEVAEIAVDPDVKLLMEVVTPTEK
ncbi:MAG: M1 family metallopeptidase [Gemmatimonadota bacterium]